MNIRSVLLLAGVAMFGAAGPSLAADVAPEPVSEFQRAFWDDATFTLHFRSYLLERYDSASLADPAAWAAGGWAGYETGWLGDVLRFGAVGYTSQPLWAPEDRDGTLLLRPGQEGYSVFGQAYVELKVAEQVMTFYRQIVNQPEVNAQDNRMTPNTFEGGTIHGDLGPLSYYGGVLTAMKKRNSIEFVNMANAADVDENEYMYLGGVEFSPIEDLKARSSIYVVPDLLASSYSDAVFTAPLSDEAKLRLSAQFMFQDAIGEEYLPKKADAWMGGFKGDLIWNGLTLTAGYTINGEDNEWLSPYGSWPGYTSMIVKDFYRPEEQALLVGASFDFAGVGADGLVFTALAAFDTDVADDLPERNEYDFTADYRFKSLSGDWEWLSPLWFRARYALVDTDETDGNQNQIDDFRVIVNYELQFSGKDL